MSNFNLREYLFNDRPGDEMGKRTEIIITLALGFIVTTFWALAYKHPAVRFFAGASSLSSLFSFIQTVRGKKITLWSSPPLQ